MQPIGDIAQEQPGPLLPFFFDIQRQIAVAGIHRRLGVANRSLGRHLVAPHADPFDRLQHLDPPAPPSGSPVSRKWPRIPSAPPKA
jgi:hypothetical protein